MIIHRIPRILCNWHDMEQLIECVPNFSEGRRSLVIDEIAKVIRTANTVKLIDIHSDKDHNRSVFTLIGTPDEIEAAVFIGIKKAAASIDLNFHHGCHPRIGAADVIPFIPLHNTDMNDCIRIAHRLGKRVGDELNIPVFLYGEATVRPEHRNLADIRRGEFESLRTSIGTDAMHTPDFGPSVLGPSGASAIGARDFLIAFNIFLDTPDIHAAKFIAKKIRESSGGLKNVKALGMLVNNKAQVSMNLTNFRVTSIQTVFNEVKKHSESLGISLHHSELVGCLPKAAIEGFDRKDIMLYDFKPNRILENNY